MSVLDDLATLPVGAEFEVPVADGSYEDPTPPAPLKEGNYRFRVVDFELDKKQDGSLNLTDGVWPVVNLKKIEVVEPADQAGRAVTFQRVYSKPFSRTPGGPKGSSGLADLVRSHDQTIGFRTAQEGIEALAQLVGAGSTFRGRVIWTAYDKDLAESRYAEIGGKSVATPEQHKTIRKAATVKGMKKFPARGDGSYSPVMTGPSGATLEARGELSSFYPSGADKINLG